MIALITTTRAPQNRPHIQISPSRERRTMIRQPRAREGVLVRLVSPVGGGNQRYELQCCQHGGHHGMGIGHDGFTARDS